MLREAASNLTELRWNPYPGRGIVVGCSSDGKSLIQVYWIMGRSENSRNRVFKKTARHVFTAPADPAKIKDPRLIIYNAMCECRTGLDYNRNTHFVVSNGNQTDTIGDHLESRRTFYSAMLEREFEPDTPNFTPRISAICSPTQLPIAQIAIQRRAADGSCIRSCYCYDNLVSGVGYCVTTYLGDGDPLPAFDGAPYVVPLVGDINEIADKYWNMLNAENKVSLVVKFIESHSGASTVVIRNKFAEVKTGT